MTEERAQPCRDERRGKPESGTRLERDAVADNRFRVTLGRHGAFVLPLPHAQHRRILAKPPSRLELGDAEPVIVEWQHTEQSQPGTSDRRAIGTVSTVIPFAPRGTDIVIQGRNSSLMPSGVRPVATPARQVRRRRFAVQ